MDFFILMLVSCVVSALTLVSGFGLGTVLMPVFAIFFPVEVAIAATAVVHLVNNLFKLALVGRWARWSVVLRFGLPAMLAALAGAALLTYLAAAGGSDASGVGPLATYAIGPIRAEITTLKLVTAFALAALASLELWPRYQRLSLPAKALPLGGLISGFAGGLTGMQGALRAPFLLRLGLDKEQFVGTTSVVSTMVDLVRLGVYAVGLFGWSAAPFLARDRHYASLSDPRALSLVAAACLAGCLGVLVAKKWLHAFTMKHIRLYVALLLFSLAVAMAAGIV